MDGAHISAFPHLSWCAYALAVRPPRVVAVHECRHVTHRLWLATSGTADVRWATKGTEATFHARAGSAGFFPCDGDRHAMTMTSGDGYRTSVLCLPADHLRAVAASEGLEAPESFRPIPVFRDATIRACVLRLTVAGDGFEVSEDIGTEIAARQIVLSLCELIGGGPPEWRKDSSTFAPVVMRRIVALMDADVGSHTSLESLCAEVGLSPSHFARKFRQSVGLSVNRFLNRRRVRRAFRSLHDSRPTLSRLALDLGFASQSHFTRVFSGLTGLTPLQFRRLRMHAGGPAGAG